MLFSQPDVASFLSESFECAWESVRPVPRLTVDFGEGRRLERTLRGNIATYLCTADGGTFDLVPGLVDGPEYVERLREGLRLHAGLRALEHLQGSAPFFDSARLVADWHRGLAAPGRTPGSELEGPPEETVIGSNPPSPWGAAPPPGPGSRILAPTPGRTSFASKAAVEQPLETALGVASAPGGAAALPLALESLPPDDGTLRSLSKFQVEPPLEGALVASPVPGGGSPALLLDTLDVRQRGYRAAHALLAPRALARPAELARDVYRELLHVDLDDPYLGLAPDVLGGEVGRH